MSLWERWLFALWVWGIWTGLYSLLTWLDTWTN